MADLAMGTTSTAEGTASATGIMTITTTTIIPIMTTTITGPWSIGTGFLVTAGIAMLIIIAATVEVTPASILVIFLPSSHVAIPADLGCEWFSDRSRSGQPMTSLEAEARR